MEPQSPTHAVPITEWKEREQLDAKVVNGVQELLLASVSVFFLMALHTNLKFLALRQLRW